MKVNSETVLIEPGVLHSHRLHILLYLLCFLVFSYCISGRTMKADRRKYTHWQQRAEYTRTHTTDTKFISKTERVAGWHGSRAKWTEPVGGVKMGSKGESHLFEHIQAFTAALLGENLPCFFWKTRKFSWPVAVCVSTVTRLQVDYANQVGDVEICPRHRGRNKLLKSSSLVKHCDVLVMQWVKFTLFHLELHFNFHFNSNSTFNSKLLNSWDTIKWGKAWSQHSCRNTIISINGVSPLALFLEEESQTNFLPFL